MEKRVVIVDFNHMVYNMFYSPNRLSTQVIMNGEVINKDTTIQNGCIKNIFRWTDGGSFPTAICFDRPVPSRKHHWQTAFPDMKVGSGNEYKGNREKMPESMFEAIGDCETILRASGVPCFAEKNYESDDLIYACVQRAKEKYPGMPIDIVTNDADLLPLVDDTVSVFLRSKKGTEAVNKYIEKNKYVQVTPENYNRLVGGLSAYNGFYLPYNTMLLYKILRGDSSDNFLRKEISRKFSKLKFNDLVYRMENDGIDIASVFRYSRPKYEYFNSVTGEIFNGTLEEALKSPDRPNLKQRLKDSDTLCNILNVLNDYTDLTEEQLEIVRQVYLGLNLNQPYVFKESKLLTRLEYKVGVKNNPDIDVYKHEDLRKNAKNLRINLPEL